MRQSSRVFATQAEISIVPDIQEYDALVGPTGVDALWEMVRDVRLIYPTSLSLARHIPRSSVRRKMP